MKSVPYFKSEAMDM